MAQYDFAPGAGVAGLLYDLNPVTTRSFLCEESGGIPFGCAVVEGTAADQCKLPTASSLAKHFRGVAIRTHAIENLGDSEYQDEENMSVLAKGRAWVPVEAAVTTSDRVYMRTTAAGTERYGDFRADGDGTAKVVTVTPSAANTTAYRMQIELDDGRKFEFGDFTSDADATAAEIVTGLKALIDAEAELTGLVTASGDDTLVLTGDKGVNFYVSADGSAGTLAIALTTPLSSDCVYLPNARWVKGGSSLAVVELS